MPSAAAIAPGPYTTQDFLDGQTLVFADEVVASVFAIMLGLATESVPPSSHGPNEVTAIVGFSGSMRGSCELRLASDGARKIASAMLGGASVEEGDGSIDDAVGELCNMIAGGWKNSISTLASTCSLSPPTVISGCDYKIHRNATSAKLRRTYRFEAHTLQLTLHCLEPKIS